MSRIRVAVLRGGPSSHHETSLKTGAAVLRNLDSEKYIPIDVYIDKGGAWYMGGVPAAPADLSNRADVVWNALHGTYGEDGGVQQTLESLRIPYTGSSAGVSAFAAHKAKAREVYKRWEIPTLPWTLIDTEVHNEDDVREIFRSFPQPVAVMPVQLGADEGVSPQTYGYHELMDAVLRAREYSPHIVVESRPRGYEVACGTIDDFRDEKIYALIPLSVSDNGRRQLRSDEIERIQEFAKHAHDAFGARHYSLSTFLVTPQNIYIIETRTSPDIHEDSLFSQSLEAVGCTHAAFLDHVINNAKMA